MKLHQWSDPKIRTVWSSALKGIASSFLVVFAILPAASTRPSGGAAGQSGKNDTKSAPSLGREIRHQIAALPFYSVFDSIAFTLDGKKVTLTGQVLRPMLKRHAEEAIKSLEGVDVVVDQIEVLPNSATDDELRRGIYRAIFEDPELAPYAAQASPPIHIVVKNGSVTLEGTVKSMTDKNLAGMRASGVANVSGVKNNLNVHIGQAMGEQGQAK
jgi:hyperosmotically inducible protein